MNAANALSRRDGTSMRWLTNYRLARRDYRGALELMDAALRRDPDQGATLHPTLAFVSADPAAQRAIAAKLREQPPWRRGMIDYLAGWQAPESTRALLLSLKNGPTPPDATEVAYYVGRLYREGRYAEARAEAMAFGPSRNDTRTVVFDGDFSGRVGVAPFNWVIGADPGAPAAIEAWPDRPGDKSLHVQHDGFSRAGFASQTIASPPGEQVFSGEVVAIPADLAEGLHWVVICAESGDQILKARVNGGPEPRRFAVRFTVPSTDCSAQYLQLRSEPGDRRAYVDVWFDNIAIRPAKGT